MIISQELEEIKAALALQAKCSLKCVSLRQCHVSREATEESLNPPFSLRISNNSTANAINDAVLRIEVRFQVQSYDSSEAPALLFSVECAFDLDYELDDREFQPAAESIVAFKDGNAVFNCWPYAREFVQNITSRMGLNPPPLPFLRILPKQPKDDSSAIPVIAKTRRPSSKQTVRSNPSA